MKKAILLTLFTLIVALPTLAEEERHQSFISFDDGGTLVRSGEDGREIEAHRNLPIYPGDEVATARRGRAEVRLSDGNIVGLDRSTVLLFRSILDAYEGDSNETVAELREGKVAVHRTDIGRQHVRLDTPNASYVATDESIYSVETTARGKDRVTVFEGSLEVRTPRRATRLRRGESATIDEAGVYELIGDQRAAADDFERWFLKRAERFDNYNSRYVDRRLGYFADDLDDHGRWVFVTGIGWSWRPIVSVGWRPYHQGYWHRGRNGCLTWVSHDPWGWGPYHYGRWAHDPGYGWIWVPGHGYSPAWVYWWYGTGYVGWAPAGYWDCHRNYYDWAYRPYRNRDYGFGFNGRVRVSEMDLRPWTFVDSTGLISNRADRAALTTDAIKQRLGRSGSGGFDTISGSPARFTREELRDPAAAIRRRGLGGDNSAATAPDMTSYFRRDPNVSGSVRDRIVRSRGTVPSAPSSSTPSASTPTDARAAGGGGRINRGGSGVAPVAGGGVAPIGRGSVAPITGGSPAPITGGSPTGSIDRGSSTPAPATPTPAEPSEPRRGINRGRDRDTGDTPRSTPSWRDRVTTPADTPQAAPPPSASTPAPAPAPSDDGARDNSWRRRVRSGEPSTSQPSDSGRRDSGSSTSGGGSDVPSRVIDRIGGARIYPRDSGGSSGDSGRRSTVRDPGSRSSGSGDSGRVRESAPRSESPRPTRVQSSSGSSSSGSSSGRSSGGGGGSKDSGGGSKSSGGNRGDDGKIKKD